MVSIPRYSELSPGEQQRLAWARMLFRGPRLAVLDEATSGVSKDLETEMYSEASDEDRERLTSALEVCHLTSVSARYGDSVRENW